MSGIHCLPAKGSIFPSFSNKMSDTVHKEKERDIETSYIKRVDDTYRMNINKNMTPTTPSNKSEKNSERVLPSLA